MICNKFSARVLSACTLKILACVFMLVDHMGVVFFPQYEWMRIVGRLAYPLFAFFIAEGCRYTRNKLKRFLSVFVLGLICEGVYIAFTGEYYGNILLTFSLSILLIYLLQASKKVFCRCRFTGAMMFVLFGASLFLAYLFCKHIGVDYGFCGVITPVLVTVFDSVSDSAKQKYNLVHSRIISLFMLAVGLVLMALEKTALGCQLWALLALVLLVLYNGQKGRYSLKYAFYLFYPLHLATLQIIDTIIQYNKF